MSSEPAGISTKPVPLCRQINAAFGGSHGSKVVHWMKLLRVRVFLSFPQMHWILAAEKAGDFDWGMPMLLLGLKTKGS